MSKHGPERINKLFFEIQMVIIKSLLSIEKIMINDKHCFELYGYDVMIDENLKPWLLEVNASPSVRLPPCSMLNREGADFVHLIALSQHVVRLSAQVRHAQRHARHHRRGEQVRLRIHTPLRYDYGRRMCDL